MNKHTIKLTKLAKTLYDCELENLTPPQLQELEEHIKAQANIKKMNTETKVELLIRAMSDLKAERDIKEFK